MMSIENPNETPSEMTDGRDDPNKGPIDRAENALEGRDDPNMGPLDRADDAIDGRDDPNKGPLDRAANAMTGGTGGVAAATSGTSGSTYSDSGSTTAGKATAVFYTRKKSSAHPFVDFRLLTNNGVVPAWHIIDPDIQAVTQRG